MPWKEKDSKTPQTHNEYRSLSGNIAVNTAIVSWEWNVSETDKLWVVFGFQANLLEAGFIDDNIWLWRSMLYCGGNCCCFYHFFMTNL